MSDGKFPPLTDNLDDLPRTLRRERESRDRAAREQQAKDDARAQSTGRTAWDRDANQSGSAASSIASYDVSDHANPYDVPLGSGAAAPVDATVRHLRIPFFSLMGFFIKAVFAAIPALLILVALLYGLGVALQQYFPQLIKMKILITFPG